MDKFNKMVQRHNVENIGLKALSVVAAGTATVLLGSQAIEPQEDGEEKQWLYAAAAATCGVYALTQVVQTVQALEISSSLNPKTSELEALTETEKEG